ncbi:hypothetical protein [Methylocystis sp. S23]
MTGKIAFKARMTGADLKRWLAEEKENLARRRACPGHRFPLLVAEWDRKYECSVCGATAKAEYVMQYCEGFKAAGGDPRVVCSNVEGEA